MSTRTRALAVLLGVLCSTAALAGDIYRCKVNGVTTFVDSPRSCPEGDARRQGGDETKAKDAGPSAARTGDSPQGPGAASRSRLTSSPLPQRPGLATLHAASRCQRLAHDPARARECLREERRAEVRQIASARLAGISRAVTDYVSAASSSGGVLAVSNKGRPPAWCESILADVMAQKEIDVVDDETTGGPEFVQDASSPGRSAVEILDPDFKEWTLAGGKVPDGYVTARWRTSNLVVLRVVAACTEGSDGAAHCNPQRHTSIYVYDTVTPVACDVTAVGRAYWPNWKNSMTPIFAKGTRR